VGPQLRGDPARFPDVCGGVRPDGTDYDQGQRAAGSCFGNRGIRRHSWTGSDAGDTKQYGHEHAGGPAAL
jgi:hypothetical protein